MKRDLYFERQLRHAPERVWQALTDSRLLAQWFGENDFQPVVGHQFRILTDKGPTYDGILYCEVLEVDAPKRLVYSFRGGMMEHVTTVTWTLTPRDGGTLLRLEHTGFAGLKDVIVSHIIGFGWGKYLAKLVPLLDGTAQQV